MYSKEEINIRDLFSNKKISMEIYEKYHRRKFYFYHLSWDRKMVQNAIRNVDEEPSGRESRDTIIVAWGNKTKRYPSNR